VFFEGIPVYLETTYNNDTGKNESVLINFDPTAAIYDYT
jgi:hypothetical protein